MQPVQVLLSTELRPKPTLTYLMDPFMRWDTLCFMGLLTFSKLGKERLERPGNVTFPVFRRAGLGAQTSPCRVGHLDSFSMRCMGHHLGDLEDTKSKKYYKLSLLWCWWFGFWAVSSHAGIRTRGCDPAFPTSTKCSHYTLFLGLRLVQLFNRVYVRGATEICVSLVEQHYATGLQILESKCVFIKSLATFNTASCTVPQVS